MLAKNVEGRLAGSTILPYEIKLATKSGEVKILRINGNRFVIDGEKLDLTIFRDVTEENKIQDELRQALLESEERFHNITNSIKEAIIVVNEEAKVTYWNPAAEKTFGFTIKEAVGKDIHELVVPRSMCKEGRERAAESVKTFAQTGMGYFTVGNVELVGKHEDGTEFPVELSISPTKLVGKWNAVAVFKDITKRKQAEQKLRDAEQRYHSIFNQAPLGVLVVDPETTRFIEFNDVAHQQFGYSREEFEKITICDLATNEGSEQVKSHMKDLLKKGVEEFEILFRTKNGDIKNTSVIARTLQSAGKKYLHCICRDLSEIEKVQNALMASEAGYRQLVELAQEGIWAVDGDFTTVFVNPRMAEMLGYAQSEMIGRKLFEFLDKEKVAKIRETLKQFRNQEIDGLIEYAFPRKDGTHVDTIITMSTIMDDEGQVTGTLAVISDISERKRAERALKESEELSKAIVANAPIGIATSDLRYHFLSANEAFCKILGYEEDEILKLTFKEITYPEDLPESEAKMAALESGIISSLMHEKRYFKKDGTTIVGRIIVNAIRNQTGQPILFIVELEDITKSKRLEDDLRSSEERFRAISTSAMDAIILSDEEDRVVYWNPAAEKMFGFLQSEAIGRKLAELVIPPHGQKKHEALLKELMRNQLSKRHFGFNALKKDGNTFPMDLTVATVTLKEKNVCCQSLEMSRSGKRWKKRSNKSETC